MKFCVGFYYNTDCRWEETVEASSAVAALAIVESKDKELRGWLEHFAFDGNLKPSYAGIIKIRGVPG